MSEPARELYDISAAADALSDSASGLEDTLRGLAGSKTLTIIGRLSSGILPGFWSIQNKIRAAFDYAEIYYSQEEKRSKKMIKNMKAIKQLKLMEGTFPKDLFKEDYFKEIQDKMSLYDDPFGVLGDSEKFTGVAEKYDKLSGGLKDFELYEEMILGKPAENDDERLYFLKEITRLLAPQHQKAERRKAQIEKRRNFEIELNEEFKKFKGDDNIALRKFLLRKKKQITESLKAIPGNLKKLGTFAIGALKVFAVLSIVLVIVSSILKSAWPALQAWGAFVIDFLKELAKAFAIVGYGLGLVISGILAGDFTKVIRGLLHVAVGLIVSGIALIVGGILVALGFFAALIGHQFSEFVRSFKDDSINTKKALARLVGQVVMIGALILGIGAFISGGWIATIPYIIAAVVGAIFKGMGKKATGGVVTKGMTLVGEKGPELVSLPAGSRVYSNQQSRRMGGSTVINVNVSGRVGASDAEIKDIANKVAREINLRMNRTATTGARF